MIKPLITDLEARQELEDAAWWYEEQKPTLGEHFLQAVTAALDRVARFPTAGSPVPHVPSDLKVRRVPVKRFPYHVVYLETPDVTRILAVAHDRRKPGYWLGRLSEGG